MSGDGFVSFWLVDQYLFSPAASVQPSSPGLVGSLALRNQGLVIRLSSGSSGTGKARATEVEKADRSPTIIKVNSTASFRITVSRTTGEISVCDVITNCN